MQAVVFLHMFIICGRHKGIRNNWKILINKVTFQHLLSGLSRRITKQTNSQQIFIFKLHRRQVLVDEMLPLFETNQIWNWLKDCSF